MAACQTGTPAPETCNSIDDNCDGQVDEEVCVTTTSTIVSTTTTTIDGGPVDADTDHDGMLDASDICPVIPNNQQNDADGDGIGDMCDATPGCGTGCGLPLCEQPIDLDSDGTADFIDNCPNVCNGLQLDANGDGIGDVCDSTPGCGDEGQPACEQPCDLDNDGIFNSLDNCPDIANPQQLDADGDGTGDMCDLTPGCGARGQSLCEGQVDTDGDGWADSLDSCPAICNVQQLDADDDGTGDACDTTPGCGGCGQPVCEEVCTP